MEADLPKRKKFSEEFEEIKADIQKNIDVTYRKRNESPLSKKLKEIILQVIPDSKSYQASDVS